MADLFDPIRIDGLRETQRAFRDLGPGAAKALRLVLNDAADVVVDEAQRDVEVASGRARKSIRATSSQTTAKVTGGGARAPYYPWLDFGGKVGPHKSVRRPFRKGGRYLYPGFTRRRAYIMSGLDLGLADAVDAAGLEMD